MFTIDQVETGIVKYLDAELASQYPENSIQKLAIGTGVALLIKSKKEQAVTLMQKLGLVNDNQVDIDILKEELLKRMPAQGISYENQFLGKITFTKEDINKIYALIKE